MRQRKVVVMTGRSLSSPLGQSLEPQVEAWRNGRSSFGVNQDFTHTPAAFAGRIESLHPLPDRKIRKVITRKDHIGIVTALAAAENAGVQKGDVDPQRFGMFVGSGCTQIGDLEPYYGLIDKATKDGVFSSQIFGEGLMSDVNPMVMMQTLMNNTLCYTAIQLDIRGVNGNFMDFQNAGMRALIEGFYAIQENRADIVLVGGVTATPEPYHAEQGIRMGYLAAVKDQPEATIRPFDALRCGTILSEGSAFLVLESQEHAERRGATIYGEVVGVASGCDGDFAYVQEARSPGLEYALTRLLRRYGLPHFMMSDANGGILSDRVEYAALSHVFSDKLRELPFHAAKSTFGEMSESSAMASVVLGIESIRSGALPCTKNLFERDPQFQNLCLDPYQPRTSNVFLVYTRAFSGSGSAVYIRGMSG